MDQRATEPAGSHLPLPALLSFLFVALTIELDNEFEHQMSHRTTNHDTTPGTTSGAGHAPWLTSYAMWANCLRFVGERDVTVAELERLARTPTNLDGMRRWGYITVAPDPADPRPKPPLADWVIRATPAGQQADRVWRPLFAIVAQRWGDRFGADAVADLRASLWAVARQFDVALPDCLPILGYGLWSNRLTQVARQAVAPERPPEAETPLPLVALLAWVLLAFTLAYERESDVSLALSANVLRLAGDGSGVRVRDLPRLAGMSKEAAAVALKYLAKHGYGDILPGGAGSRLKTMRLTAKGQRAREAYHQRVGALEEEWQMRYGTSSISQLRAALERIVGDPTAAEAPLLRGLQPYPDGWRAAVPRPERLPHFPLVLHRGGYPDGS